MTYNWCLTPLSPCFRINSTHIFMVGGLSNTYELEDEFTDDVPKDVKGCPKDYPPYLVQEIEDNTVGGGKFFREAWVYDGFRWSQTEPMSSVRDNPVCSLVEMDDGEVLICFPRNNKSYINNPGIVI